METVSKGKLFLFVPELNLKMAESYSLEDQYENDIISKIADFKDMMGHNKHYNLSTQDVCHVDTYFDYEDELTLADINLMRRLQGSKAEYFVSKTFEGVEVLEKFSSLGDAIFYIRDEYGIELYKIEELMTLKTTGTKANTRHRKCGDETFETEISKTTIYKDEHYYRPFLTLAVNTKEKDGVNFKPFEDYLSIYNIPNVPLSLKDIALKLIEGKSLQKISEENTSSNLAYQKGKTIN